MDVFIDKRGALIAGMEWEESTCSGGGGVVNIDFVFVQVTGRAMVLTTLDANMTCGTARV